MPDPIQIEENFQDLVRSFGSTPSIRHRHKLFFEFLELLEGEFRKYESYIHQLLDELPIYKGYLSWSGIDPEEIEEKLVMLKSIDSTIDVSDKGMQFFDLITNLREVWLLLQVCVGNIKKTDEVFQKLTGVSWPETKISDQLTPDKNQSIITLYEHLSTELQKNQKRPVEQAESLLRLYKEVKGLVKGQEWNILIPVVERYGGVHQKNREYGRLRNMTIELYGESESRSKDELNWVTNIYGAEKSPLEMTESPIIASRNLLKMFIPRSASEKYYRGSIQFENVKAIHNGNSANLAIAALWYTILLKKAGQRERYLIHSNSAITADIDRYGNIKTVDEESIELKVKAVFFSWAEVLVVPASQRYLFEVEIKELNRKYPERKLPIVGVNHLKDIFYDRRVATYTVQGRIPYMLKRLKKEHSKFVLVPVILVLLLIIARMAYGPIDRNPVLIEYAGSDIVLKNSSGSTIDRLEVGESTVNYQNTGNSNEQYPLAVLTDFDEDDTNELVFINRVGQSKLETPTLKAWSVTGDSLIWEHHITFNYRYPRQSAFMNFGLRASELQVMNTNDGTKIILNAGLIQYFQSVVFTLDAVSGKIEQEYVHPGRLNDIMVYDIDEDQVDELIFTGINNAYWNAMIGVLEYGEAHGYGPATIDYIPTGLNRANEELYLLIPKSVIGRYFNTVWKYNSGQRIHYDALSEIFYFTVVEGTQRFTEFEDEIEILFYFDRDLIPVGIGTNDLYDTTARNLYQRGEIKIEPDFDYFESLQDSILYRHEEQFLITEEYFKNN